jgi:hypothetical protein
VTNASSARRRVRTAAAANRGRDMSGNGTASITNTSPEVGRVQGPRPLSEVCRLSVDATRRVAFQQGRAPTGRAGAFVGDAGTEGDGTRGRSLVCGHRSAFEAIHDRLAAASLPLTNGAEPPLRAFRADSRPTTHGVFSFVGKALPWFKPILPPVGCILVKGSTRSVTSGTPPAPLRTGSIPTSDRQMSRLSSSLDATLPR